jgi:hypothetical protein
MCNKKDDAVAVLAGDFEEVDKPEYATRRIRRRHELVEANPLSGQNYTRARRTYI